MCVIVSMHFSGSNRATRLYESCSGKKSGTSGEGAKTRRGGKDDRQGRAKGLFSIQMHVCDGGLCTHARTLRGILLISYSFLLFSPYSSRSSLLVNARPRKILMVSPGRRHYNAAYVNTIAGKRRKNEKGRHEGEYPAGANEG